jgi:RNA polymerase sigma-70 factor (ECF subfamily)
VRNGAISAARSEQRRRKHESAAAAVDWFLPGEETSLDAASAAAAIQSLPEAEREVLTAHLWGGLTFEQIATISRVSTSTAHRRYQAALSALRAKLRVPCPTNANRPT